MAQSRIELYRSIALSGSTKGQHMTLSEDGSVLISVTRGASGHVAVPKGVKIIREGAFDECRFLTEVTIPDGVTTIDALAFFQCTLLKKVVIPNSLTTIGPGAFAYCLSLTQINIPNSVLSIDAGAFSHCSALTEVTIPDSVRRIGERAFQGCRRLTKFIIPNGVDAIAPYLFYGCHNLAEVIIPNNVKVICTGAFVNCGVTQLIIPNCVIAINPMAFTRNHKLTQIVIADDSYDRLVAFLPDYLDSLAIPESCFKYRSQFLIEAHPWLFYSLYSMNIIPHGALSFFSHRHRDTMLTKVYYDFEKKFTSMRTLGPRIENWAVYKEKVQCLVAPASSVWKDAQPFIRELDKYIKINEQHLDKPFFLKPDFNELREVLNEVITTLNQGEYFQLSERSERLISSRPALSRLFDTYKGLRDISGESFLNLR